MAYGFACNFLFGAVFCPRIEMALVFLYFLLNLRIVMWWHALWIFVIREILLVPIRLCALIYSSSSCHAKLILWDREELSPYRNSYNGFRTFCTGGDFAAKKCVPCNAKDLRPMAEETATGLMAKVPEWSLMKEDGVMKLSRSLKSKSFTKGLELFKLVGDLAEAEGHHPDLHLVGWNNVKIEIWTHAVGGLTENDFILAAKINKLDLHHLLRKSTTS